MTLGNGANRVTSEDIAKITDIVKGRSLEELGLNIQQAVLLLSAGKALLKGQELTLPKFVRDKYDETLQMYREGLQLIDNMNNKGANNE